MKDNLLLLCFAFCFIGTSIFAQDAENVIVLKLPNEAVQTSTVPSTTAPKLVTSVNLQQDTPQNDPIYVADGVIIENLNVLDPSTIISVDVLDNKIVIKTNRKPATTTTIASR